MLRFITHILSNIAGLYLIIRFVDGVEYSGNWKILILTALVLSIINFVLRPILKFIFGPIIFLTLGIFLIVINMALLWLSGWLVGVLFFKDIFALFWSTIIIGVLNFFASLVAKSES